eukprot:3397073-Lingulodinium_polyedra.AAC.1
MPYRMVGGGRWRLQVGVARCMLAVVGVCCWLLSSREPPATSSRHQPPAAASHQPPTVASQQPAPVSNSQQQLATASNG